jgi:hypothetical protein
VQGAFLALAWLEGGGDVVVFSRSRRATSRDSVASHSVSHAALSHATPCWVRAFDRDSCTVLAARSISRQRRKRSAASLRSRLRVSGQRKIPVRSAWTDEGRNAEIGNLARGSPVDGSRMTGMWAPRPSMIARYLDETAEKNQILLTDPAQSTLPEGETTRAV